MKTLELEQTGQDQRAWKGLESVLGPKDDIEIQTCDHTPDKLILLGTDYHGDRIVQHFYCQCGKNVDEIFRLSETVVV